MKLAHFYMFSATLILAACGAPSSSDSGSNPAEEEPADESPDQEGEGTLTNTFAMVVQSDADLPACDTATKNQLVYVSAGAQFKTCDGATWTVIEIKGEKGDPGAKGTDGLAGEKGDKGDKGESGADGVDIAGIFNLSSATTDLCTRYSNEFCFFSGGIATAYTDGLVQFSGSLFSYIEFDIGGGALDTDSRRDAVGPSYCATDNLWCSLSFVKITRAGSDTARRLWLVFKPAEGEFYLSYDDNNNDVYEPGVDLDLEALEQDNVEID